MLERIIIPGQMLCADVCSWEMKNKKTKTGFQTFRKSERSVAQYVAMRQRDSHHVLGVDLQRADGLSSSSVFGLDGKLGDEAVDAVRQEPGDHDKRVVLRKRRQVGDEARSCRGCMHT